MGLRIVHITTEDNIEFAFQFLVLPEGVRFEFAETTLPFELCGDGAREDLPA